MTYFSRRLGFHPSVGPFEMRLARTTDTETATEPSTWAEVDASSVGSTALRLSARRRARHRSAAGASTSAGASSSCRVASGFVDPLGYGVVDVETLVARALGEKGTASDADVSAETLRARRRVRDEVSIASEGFDALTYLGAAHGTRSEDELRAGADNVRLSIEDEEGSRKDFVAEHLPNYLACLDAMEDARGLLRQAREENGEFGVTYELETRMTKTAESAHQSLGEVFDLEDKRAKLVRVLKLFEKHKDLFSLPSTIRDALSKGDYDAVAKSCDYAFASLSDQHSQVWDIVLDEIRTDIHKARERLYEKLYVGELDDSDAEKTILALRTLARYAQAVPDANFPDPVKLYIDRLVQYARDEMSELMSSNRADVQLLSREFRSHYVRAWRFITLLGDSRESNAKDALKSLQLDYADLVKATFDETLHRSTVSVNTPPLDAVMAKCDSMMRVGVEPLVTFDILRDKLQFSSSELGLLQQLNVRCGVSLRVHLEQAMKLSFQTSLSEQSPETLVNTVFAAVMQKVFAVATQYWCNPLVGQDSRDMCSRDVTSLLQCYHRLSVEFTLRLVDHASSDATGETTHLDRIRLVHEIETSMRQCSTQFQALHALSTEEHSGLALFQEKMADVLKTLTKSFIDVQVARVKSLQESWMATKCASDVATLTPRDGVIEVIRLLANVRCSAAGVLSQSESRLISDAIQRRCVDDLRDRYTQLLNSTAGDSSMRTALACFAFEFEFLKIALERAASEAALSGLARLTDIARRVSPTSDQIALNRALQSEISRHQPLLDRLSSS